MGDRNTGNPRSEWSALPIQDRIRAMRESLEHEDTLEEPNDFTPTTLPSTESDESNPETPTGPRRASVVDMWRKREGVISSAIVKQKPKPRNLDSRDYSVSPINGLEKTASFKFEEKKESTEDENQACWGTPKPVVAVVTPRASDFRDSSPVQSKDANAPPRPKRNDVRNSWKKRNISAVPLPKVEPSHVAQPLSYETEKKHTSNCISDGLSKEKVSDSPARQGAKTEPDSEQGSNVRNMWRQRDSSLQAERKDSFGSGASSSVSNTPSNASSFIGSQVSRGSVLDRWNKPSSSNAQSPCEGKTRQPYVIEAPASPAFSDLRSKWDKFGTEKEKNRGTPPPKPCFVGPSKIGTFRKQSSLRNLTTEPPDKNRANEAGAPLKRTILPTTLSNRNSRSEDDLQNLRGEDREKQVSPPCLRVDKEPVKKGEGDHTVPFKGAETKNNDIGSPSLGKGIVTAGTATPKKTNPLIVGQTHAVSPKHNPEEVECFLSPEESSLDGHDTRDFKEDEGPAPPKKSHFAARKHLLEKHRRRAKTSSVQSRDDEAAALSHSFQDADLNAQQERLSEKLVSRNKKIACSGTNTVGVSIPAKTLLYHDSTEENKVVGEKSLACQRFASTDTSGAKAKKPMSPKAVESSFSHSATRSNSDDFSDVDSSIDESFKSSVVSSTFSGPSMLASRAGRHLRDKRLRQQAAANLKSDGQSASVDEVNSFDQDHDPEVPEVEAPQRTRSIRTPEDEIIAMHAKTSAARSLGVGRRDSPFPSRTFQPRTVSPASVCEHSTASSSGRATESSKTPHMSPSFESFSSASQIISTAGSSEFTGPPSHHGYETLNARRNSHRSPTIVAEEFVSESNNNVQAFRSAYQELSLEQIANDMKEQASSVLNVPGLDFSKLAVDLNQSLNVNMAAATESLHKLVDSDFFQQKSIPVKRRSSLAKRESNLEEEEEVAIEVEYVAD